MQKQRMKAQYNHYIEKIVKQTLQNVFVIQRFCLKKY